MPPPTTATAIRHINKAEKEAIYALVMDLGLLLMSHPASSPIHVAYPPLMENNSNEQLLADISIVVGRPCSSHTNKAGITKCQWGRASKSPAVKYSQRSQWLCCLLLMVPGCDGTGSDRDPHSPDRRMRPCHTLISHEDAFTALKIAGLSHLCLYSRSSAISYDSIIK